MLKAKITSSLTSATVNEKNKQTDIFFWSPTLLRILKNSFGHQHGNDSPIHVWSGSVIIPLGSGRQNR